MLLLSSPMNIPMTISRLMVFICAQGEGIRLLGSAMKTQGKYIMADSRWQAISI